MGCKLKLRGMGKRLQLSEYREAERKYEVAEKTSLSLEVVFQILISVTLCKFKIIPEEQAVFPQGHPSNPGWLTGLFRIQGERRMHFLVLS